MRGGRNRWVALLLLGVLLAGCWDRRELEEKSNVLATGVDVCAQNQGCNLISSRQIAIPGRIPLGGASPGPKGQETVTVLSVPAIDGPDSQRKAQAKLNQRLSFGHIRVLILSEEFARRGVLEFMDYTRRIAEARRHLWIAVAEGRAEDVIRARPPLERVPALFLSDMFDEAVMTGRLPRVYTSEFLTWISNKGEESVAPLIRMIGPDRPALTGLAVFRNDRMVGKLSRAEMATYMQLRAMRKGGELLLIDLPDGNRADLSVFGRKVNFRVHWVEGRVHAKIEMQLESELIKLSPVLMSSEPSVLDMIELRAAAEVTRRANALVRKLQQEFGADILGLGERVRAYLPGAWKSIDDWPAAFADAKFEVVVRVNLRRTGMAKD